MHKTYLALLVAASICGPVAAQQINFSAIGSAVLTSGGVLDPINNLVLVGTFGTQATPYTFSLTDTAQRLQNAFTTFGTGHIGDPGGAAPAGQFDDVTIVPTGVGAAGDRLFIWVFNAPTIAAATEWAIISNNTANWTRPADGSTFPNVIDISEMTVFVPPGAIGGINTTNRNVQMQVAPVPEPSTYVLALVGLGVAAGVARRRPQAVG